MCRSLGLVSPARDAQFIDFAEDLFPVVEFSAIDVSLAFGEKTI